MAKVLVRYGVIGLICISATGCTWWLLKQYDHFYNDHTALHQLIQIEIQREQQSSKMGGTSAR